VQRDKGGENVLARALWLVLGGLLATALGLVVFLTVQQLASVTSADKVSSKDQPEQEALKDQQPKDGKVASKDQQPKEEAPEKPEAPKYQQPKYEQPNKDEGSPRW